MIYIAGLVPEGEPFEAEAVNEGIWLSEAHLNNIEKELGNKEKEIALALDKLKDENLKVQQAVSDLSEAKKEIESLRSENEKLKESPAAGMSSTSKGGDDLGDGVTVYESEITKEANRLRKLRDGK